MFPSHPPPQQQHQHQQPLQPTTPPENLSSHTRSHNGNRSDSFTNLHSNSSKMNEPLQHKQFKMEDGHQQQPAYEAMKSQHHESQMGHKNSSASVGDHHSNHFHLSSTLLQGGSGGVTSQHASSAMVTHRNNTKVMPSLQTTTPCSTAEFSEEHQQPTSWSKSPQKDASTDNNNHHYFISQQHQTGHTRTQPQTHTIYHHPLSQPSARNGHDRTNYSPHHPSGTLGKRLHHHHHGGAEHHPNYNSLQNHHHHHSMAELDLAGKQQQHWSSSRKHGEYYHHSHEHHPSHAHPHASPRLGHDHHHHQQTLSNATIKQFQPHSYQFGKTEKSSMAQFNLLDSQSNKPLHAATTGSFMDHGTHVVATTTAGVASVIHRSVIPSACSPTTLAIYSSSYVDTNPNSHGDLNNNNNHSIQSSNVPPPLPPTSNNHSAPHTQRGLNQHSSINTHSPQTLTHFREPQYMIPNTPLDHPCHNGQHHHGNKHLTLSNHSAVATTNGNIPRSLSQSMSGCFSSDLKHYSYSSASASHTNSHHDWTNVPGAAAAVVGSSHSHPHNQKPGFKWSSVLYKDPHDEGPMKELHRTSSSMTSMTASSLEEEETSEHLKASTSSSPSLPPTTVLNTKTVIHPQQQQLQQQLQQHLQQHSHLHLNNNNKKQTQNTDVLLRAASTLENHSSMNVSNVLVGYGGGDLQAPRQASELRDNNESDQSRGLFVLMSEEPENQIAVETTTQNKIANFENVHNYQQPKKMRKLSNSSSLEERNSQNGEAISTSSESISVSHKKSSSTAQASNSTTSKSAVSSRAKRSNKVVSYAEYAAAEDEDYDLDNNSEKNTNSEYLSESSEELRHKKTKSKKKSGTKNSDFKSTKHEKKSSKSTKKTSNNGKVYDSVKGTTCHQCKQKTMDLKSSCKSCHSSPMSSSTNRGSFCESCLKNRYGEELGEVVKNPDWKCPICRGICNCSNCRRKAGKNPISITTREALKSGYQSVHEMLVDRSNE
ncbi:hypothetical protein C9374_002360 [Naegleria lovaniensis]|uniref:Zinc-finger domain-containing protein n=1 Tax=Naegleria lovaniensis TaxID=51637 RepID=A0AA88GVJ2_NAELO|nr:uncharacterized protein C9374_002360 [Naegleria lovaniensis]KAG2386616.1 hypothetical protein C9374_002360 [Naegleria lovaniensis]